MGRVVELRKGANVPLSANFKSGEFDCKCKNPECQTTLVDMDHVAKLQIFRDKTQKSISINSAFRCRKHNEDIGGETNSWHVKGIATDITVAGMTPDQVADTCDSMFQGMGRYNSFTHIDSRTDVKARWDYRTKK